VKKKQKSVLLFTLYGTGHNLVHMNIVIRAMVDKGYKISIALPENCINTDSFNTHILEFLKHVKIIEHNYKHIDNLLFNSWGECGVLRSSISFNNQHYDAILALNCSQIPFLWPIFRMFNRSILKNTPAIKFGLTSTGLDHSTPTTKTKISNLIRKTLLSLHSEGAIQTIDNYAFIQLKESRSKFQKKFTLIPDPIDKIAVVDKMLARRHFAIPEDIFLVSISGSISNHPRKNCQLLINALSNESIKKKVCLLVAGNLSVDLDNYIKESKAFQDKRIFVVNRYLSDQELTTITCASDLVCTPYREHFCPSGIVLRAVKCDVPVLVPNYHWFKFMVDTFNIGWTLNALTECAVVDSLNDISEKKCELKHTTAQKNLIKQYFDEDNFAAHWLSQFDRSQVYSFEALLTDFSKISCKAQLTTRPEVDN
jgi:hypothetical protein